MESRSGNQRLESCLRRGSNISLRRHESVFLLAVLASALCSAAKCNRGGKQKFKRINLNTVSWQAQLLLQVPEDPDDVPADKDVTQSAYQVSGHLNFLPDQVGAIP